MNEVRNITTAVDVLKNIRKQTSVETVLQALRYIGSYKGFVPLSMEEIKEVFKVLGIVFRTEESK